MKRSFLRLVTRIALGAPILSLAVATGITVAAAVFALRLIPVETDVLVLLPDTAKASEVYRRTITHFGSFDYLLVVIESSKPEQEKMLVDVARLFAASLRRSVAFDLPPAGRSLTPPPAADERPGGSGRYIQSVEYDPGWEERGYTLPEMQENLIPALLTEVELTQIDELLHGGLDKRLHLLRIELDRPVSAWRRKELMDDPLGLQSIVHRDRIQPRGPILGPMRDGMFLSEDGRMLMMVIRPRRPATDLVGTRNLMAYLRQVSDYTLSKMGDNVAEQCRIGFIGSHAEAENDAATIGRDLTLTLIASFVLVVVLFILAMRRLGAIFFVGLPLIVALVWTLGAASFIFERITVVTCVFGVAIIGLGIDYAIHLYCRFLEERVGGADVDQAIETAICETGQGVIIGGVTTAVGFFGLYFTHFEGFQELGIVGGIGIFCCLAAMLFVLPPLVALSERVPEQLGLRRAPSRLGLGRLVDTVRGYPRLTLTIGLVVTAYFGYHAQQIDFDEDMRNLRDLPADYDDLVRRAENRFELPSTQIIAVVSAPTLQEALRQNDHLYRRLEMASRTFPILAFDSLRPILPSLRTQSEMQARFKEIVDIDAVEQEMRRLANRRDLKTAKAVQLLEPLRRWDAAATESNRIRFDSSSSLGFEPLVQRHATNVQYGSRKPLYRSYVITNIYPRQGEWDDQTADEFAQFLAADEEGIPSLELTGLTLVGRALKDLLKDGMVRAVILVILAVTALLILHFGGVRKAIVSIIPVLCCMIWTLGAMRLLGIDLTFLNVAVIPLILGLGIDDGVHILQRYYEGGRRDIVAAVSKTGRAVVLTSFTTMLAFGTLSFATFPGIREIGTVAVMGVGFALVAALFIVPSLLQLAGERLRLLDLVSQEKEEERRY